MNKNILLLLITVCTFGACSDQKDSSQEKEESRDVDLESEGSTQNNAEYTIHGNVGKHHEGKEVKLHDLNDRNAKVLSSAKVKKDGSFEFNDMVKEPVMYGLNFFDQHKTPIIAHQGDIKVSIDSSSGQFRLNTEGSLENQHFEYFQQLTQSESFKSGDPVAQLKSFADSIAPSYVAHYIAMDFLNNPRGHYDFLENIADKFKKDIDKYSYARPLIEKVATLDKDFLKPGTEAPNFTLPTPEGESLSLKDMRGKYVLVDFWAAWCRPCRMENPNLVRMYKKYHDKGFDILGVSLDKDREKWLSAIEKDNLEWHHVSDLKQWRSEVVEKYQIKGIPFAVLVDPEGKVVATNLRGEQLEEKLKEVL